MSNSYKEQLSKHEELMKLKRKYYTLHKYSEM